ncbi:MAG: hypothetical protein FK733_16855 [Asgard group archaeon]|nr:hypothetical protein [Asgard group archaeon]
MKFIMFWNYDFEHLKHILKKIKDLDEKRKENPDKYPKMICGPYLFHGESRGMAVCETDKDEQILNLHLYFQPELNPSFVPIETVDSVLELLNQKD